MRELSDELCRKYRLSVIEEPAGHGKNYGAFLAEKNGKPTYRGIIRGDIDRAILASVTREEFYRFLEDAGYALKLYRRDGEMLEYPSLKPPGAKGFFRFHKLGKGYSLDEIDRRILKNIRRTMPLPEEEREDLRQYRQRNPPPPYQKEKPRLYRLYLRYCYELHILEKHPASVQRVSFFMREDLIKLDRLDAQTRLLSENQISTEAELLLHRDRLTQQLDTLAGKRDALRNDARRLRRQGSLIEADAVKAEITEITKRLRELRKGVRICDDILLRSAQTRQELETFMEQQQGKEEQNHELFRRRSGTDRADESGGR